MSEEWERDLFVEVGTGREHEVVSTSEIGRRLMRAEQERDAIIDFLIPFLPATALPYQESALNVVKTAIGAIELKKDRELAAARAQVKALREAAQLGLQSANALRRLMEKQHIPAADATMVEETINRALRDTEPHGEQ